MNSKIHQKSKSSILQVIRLSVIQCRLERSPETIGARAYIEHRSPATPTIYARAHFHKSSSIHILYRTVKSAALFWKDSNPIPTLLDCNWLHFVGQNHFFVKLLLNRDFAIHSASRRFCTIYKSEKSDPLQPSERRDIPSRCPTVQSIICPDDENFLFGPSFVSKSFELLQLASVWTFQQHVRTTFSVRQTMGCLSKTQIWEDHCNRLDDVDSHLDALIHKASIAFKIQTSGRASY
jgi:hypothetical protein